MCVIFWTVDDPLYDLVIASNRDEFLSRPTLPAAWHDFSTSSSSSSSSCSTSHDILSARDSTGGGTWLGVTRSGAFATLTNFTEPSAPLPAGMDAFESRGGLVRDWLSSQSHRLGGSFKRSLDEAKRQIEGYLHSVEQKLDRFPGFNLLVGCLSAEGTVVGYITNRTVDGKVDTRRKADLFLPLSHRQPSCDGVNPVPPAGMSNSILTQPWHKVTSGSNAFLSILASSSSHPRTQEELTEQLYDLLWTSSSPPPAQRSELRNSVLISPLELPMSHRGEWYATRTSTVILIAKDGSARLVERDTFQLRGGQAVLVNGPDGSGALDGRSGGQRMYTWQIE